MGRPQKNFRLPPAEWVCDKSIDPELRARIIERSRRMLGADRPQGLQNKFSLPAPLGTELRAVVEAAGAYVVFDEATAAPIVRVAANAAR